MTDQHDIPIVAVIPTRDHADTMCLDLIDQLCDDGAVDRIIVLDNRDEPKPIPSKDDDQLDQPFENVVWMKTGGLTITQMWNLGWYEATVFALGGPVNVAFLNDDIVIDVLPVRSYMETLAERLRNEDFMLVCPDYRLELDAGDQSRMFKTEQVLGTYRCGGWCGWCFMIRGELLGNGLEPIDEQFKHWCGDDHLDWQIARAGGRCGLVKGLPLEHLGGATARLHPETHEQGHDDLRRFQEQYR